MRLQLLVDRELCAQHPLGKPRRIRGQVALLFSQPLEAPSKLGVRALIERMLMQQREWLLPEAGLSRFAAERAMQLGGALRQ